MISQNFEIFSKLHWFLILLPLFISVLLVFLPDKFKYNVKYTIAGGLIFQVLLFNGWHFYHKTFDITRFLPLHLCSISIYLVILALLSKWNLAKQLAFYWSPVAAFLAILLPDINNTPIFSFRILEFFLSHILIIVGVSYLYLIEKIQIKYKDLWLSFALLVGISLGIILPINLYLKANYMYLISTPENGSMDFLGKPPYHIISLCFLILLIWHIQFLLTKLKFKKLTND